MVKQQHTIEQNAIFIPNYFIIFQAFSVYLHCILQRLSDFDDAKDDSSQIELVLKFLQKVNIVL